MSRPRGGSRRSKSAMGRGGWQFGRAQGAEGRAQMLVVARTSSAPRALRPAPSGTNFANGPAGQAMTFFVRKRLALGPIRFGVSPRQRIDAIDDDPALSTGPGGEFVRRGAKKGFFFGDTTRFAEPSLPVAKSISSTPFWSSLKPHLGFLALMAAGVVFVLLGLAVVARKGPQGWVEIILGIAMIATPIVLTARERQAIREKEERERAEREAVEKRNRELLAAYTAALDRVRRERTPDAL